MFTPLPWVAFRERGRAGESGCTRAFPHVQWGRCVQNKVIPAGLWGLDTYTIRCPFSRTPALLQAVAFIQLQICLRLSLETDS